MGQVTFRLEGDEAGAVRAFMKLTDAQKAAELGALCAADATKRGAREVEGFSDKAVRGVQSMMAMLGTGTGIGAIVGTVTAGFKSWVTHLERIAELRREFATEGLGALGKTQPLAVQLGDVGRAGQERAAGIAGRLAKAGGMELQAAQQFAIAADVAMGGLMKGRNLQTAEMMAGFMGSIGADAESQQALMEFLSTAGATKSPEAMLLAAAKIKAASTVSKSPRVGEFAQILQRGAGGMLAQGIGLDEVLQFAVQARAAKPTPRLAATVLETLSGAAGGGTPEQREFLTAEARRRGGRFADMTMRDRIGLLGDVFQGATTIRQQDVLRQRFGKAEFEDLLSFFLPGNVEAGARAPGAIAGARPAEVLAGIEAWQRSPLARSVGGGAAREAAHAGSALVGFELIRSRAERRYKDLIESGELGVWSGSVARERGILMGEELEAEALERARRSGPQAAGRLNQVARLVRSLTASKRAPISRAFGPGVSDLQEGYQLYKQIEAAEGVTVNVTNEVHNGDRYDIRQDVTTRPADAPGG